LWWQAAYEMRKRMSLALLATDAAAVLGATWAVGHLYGLGLGEHRGTAAYLGAAVAVWLTSLATFGLYDTHCWLNHNSGALRVRQLAKACIAACLLTSLAWLLLPGASGMRYPATVSLCLLLACSALASRLVLDSLVKAALARREAVVVADDPSTHPWIRGLVQAYCSDWLISAILTASDFRGLSGPARPHAPGRARWDGGPGAVLLLNGNGADAYAKQTVQMRRPGLAIVPFEEVIEVFSGKSIHAHSGTADVLHALPPRRRRVLELVTDAAKRAGDVVLSALGLTVCLPVLLLLAAMIKIESRGPVFYRQRRAGRGGKEFALLKLRSMVDDAERETGPVWAEREDPRVTRVGKMMRRFHLDEVPQLINVLKGEMSLVGPRPERPEFIPRLTRKLPAYPLRLRERPGITGWAQIYGSYDHCDDDVTRKLEYDFYYLKHRGLLLDTRILMRTLDVALFGGVHNGLPDQQVLEAHQSRDTGDGQTR